MPNPPKFTTTIQIQLPAGITVTVTGDPAQGLIFTASATSGNEPAAIALMSTLFDTMRQSWQQGHAT